MVAAASGSPEVTHIILDDGVDVEAKSNNGWTALQVATVLKKGEVVQLLRQSGINE